MVVTLVSVAFFIALALAGATGFAVFDSRDSRYNLFGRVRDDGRCGYENLVAAQGRSHRWNGVRR
jgi:hypothetical protein